METLTIGRLAARAGVGVATIRFYERRGLLAEPERTPAGYRRYPAAVVNRLRFIRRAQELGFTLAEIGELLSLTAAAASDCVPVRHSTVRKIESIDRRIRDLQRMRAALVELQAACVGSGPAAECPILDALAAGDALPGSS
jgi:MerR family copper efflux transcriptional regulator